MNRKYKKAPKGPQILDDYSDIPSGPISITTVLDLF
jgi:hypothetical protein